MVQKGIGVIVDDRLLIWNTSHIETHSCVSVKLVRLESPLEWSSFDGSAEIFGRKDHV